jgi:hypothetical protein
MRRITEITKRDVFDLIKGGFYSQGIIVRNYISWCGRLDEVTFLNRLYDLNSLSSNDRRFKTAEVDIQTHCVEFSDWETDWVFNDNRFGLFDGEDEILLNFLCEMFHPVVRLEHQEWQLFIEVFNGLLKHDGYELYKKSHMSGRSVYGWRDISTNNVIIAKQSESLTEKFNSEYMATQINNMHNTIETSPYDAIGKAKELYESCCKTILIENNITISSNWNISHLSKEVLKILKLTPDDISDTAKASDTIKQLLGNLSAISQSTAELRNSYGSGHGKDIKFKGLTSRHARLAVGAAVTAVYFIWETYEEQQKKAVK